MGSRHARKRVVTAGQLDRLTAWSRRKPVIAVMGEFSTGKSSLMNLLIGKDLLPTQVTATRMPPVWIRHGSGAPYRVDHRGARHAVDLRNLASLPLERTAYIRIFCDAGILQHCDLIDTPGISDPNIPVESWITRVGLADAVIWCTHAVQAWRESERGAWADLPARLRQSSLLLVTRKDKITSEADLDKIGRRLERETGALFAARCFISLSGAREARQDRGGAPWAASGAQAFTERLMQMIAEIEARRRNLLTRYVAETAEAASAVPGAGVIAAPAMVSAGSGEGQTPSRD